MRRKLVAANWKMNGTVATAAAWVEGFVPRAGDLACDVVVAAPAVHLMPLASGFAGTRIVLAAENVSEYDDGAVTGEISCAMLRDIGCRAVIVGHSERRALFGETNAIVAKKAVKAAQAGLSVVVCVGETRGVREGGLAERFVAQQVRESLAGIDAGLLARVAVAYEPVWAIGTGLTATPEMAQAMHEAVRGEVAKMYSEDKAATLRILYGGSVKPANAAGLFAKSDIDGALVGGASLKANDFYEICRAADLATEGK